MEKIVKLNNCKIDECATINKNDVKHPVLRSFMTMRPEKLEKYAEAISVSFDLAGYALVMDDSGACVDIEFYTHTNRRNKNIYKSFTVIPAVLNPKLISIDIRERMCGVDAYNGNVVMDSRILTAMYAENILTLIGLLRKDMSAAQAIVIMQDNRAISIKARIDDVLTYAKDEKYIYEIIEPLVSFLNKEWVRFNSRGEAKSISKPASINDRIDTFVDHLNKIKVDNSVPSILKTVYCKHNTLLEVIITGKEKCDSLQYRKLINSFLTFRSKVESGYFELVSDLVDRDKCVATKAELSKKVYSDIKHVNSIDSVEDGGTDLINAINKFYADYPMYEMCFSDKGRIRVVFSIKERNIIEQIRDLDRFIDKCKPDIDDYESAISMLIKINKDFVTINRAYNDANLPVYSLAYKLKTNLLQKMNDAISNISHIAYKRIKEEEKYNLAKKGGEVRDVKPEKKDTLFKKVLKMVKKNNLIELSFLYGHSHIYNRALKHFIGKMAVSNIGEDLNIIATRKAYNRWFGGGKDRAEKVFAQYLIASSQYIMLEKFDEIKGDNVTSTDVDRLLSELK